MGVKGLKKGSKRRVYRISNRIVFLYFYNLLAHFNEFQENWNKSIGAEIHETSLDIKLK